VSRRFSLVIAGAAMAVLFVAVAFRSYATAQGIPPLRDDACVFLPQTLPFRERGELINTVWRPAAKLDVLGKGRMTYHGFLYPMLLSLFLWRSDYPALASVLGILYGVDTLLFCVLFWSFAKRWQWPLTPRRLLLILLLTTACAIYVQDAGGRPEPLAALVLMSGTLWMGGVSPAWRGRIAGIVIGVLGAIDPLAGVFAGLIFATCAAWWLGWRGWSVEIAGAAGLSIIVFACCFCWYPYSFADWWFGTWQMGNYALTGQRLSRTDYFLVLLSNKLSWLSLGMVLLAAWSGLRFIRRKRLRGEGPASPVAFYVMLLVFGLALRPIVQYSPWAQYNIIPFMPLVFLAVFFEMGRDHAAPLAGKQRFYEIVALIVLAYGSLAFPIDICSRIHVMRSGLNLQKARHLFETLRAHHPGEVIALPEGLFTLTEDYSNILFYRNGTFPAAARMMLVDQAGNTLLQPPAIDGFRLVTNYFNSRPLSFLGVPVLKKDRGSGFAVYSRAAAASQ